MVSIIAFFLRHYFHKLYFYSTTDTTNMNMLYQLRYCSSLCSWGNINVSCQGLSLSSSQTGKNCACLPGILKIRTFLRISVRTVHEQWSILYQTDYTHGRESDLFNTFLLG